MSSRKNKNVYAYAKKIMKGLKKLKAKSKIKKFIIIKMRWIKWLKI